MGFTELSTAYAFIGVIVALGVPADQNRLVAALLWPLVLPGLLSGGDARYETAAAPAPARPNTAIAEALDRLQDAIRQWDPAAVVSLEAIEQVLLHLDRRRTALAELLDCPDAALPDGQPHAAAQEAHEQRLAHVEALRALRARLEGELAAALARLDELVARIQLAHFSGQVVGDVAAQLDALRRAVEGAHAAHSEVEGL